MLVDISITNFRSIKEKQILSMQPVAKIKELPDNIEAGEDFKILKSMIIYGRNGSGKSNLLMALETIKYLVSHSREYKIHDLMPYTPFQLDVTTRNKPTELEINFYASDKRQYTYSFAYDKENVQYEKLFYYPGRKPTKLFTREIGGKIEVGEQINASYKNIEDSLYPNQLFLSKIGTEKLDALIPAYTFLTRHINTHTIHDMGYDNMLIQSITNIMTKNDNAYVKEGINKLLHVADIGINSISIKENKEKDFKFPADMDEEIKKKILNDFRYQVKTKHNLYNNKKLVGETEFKINDESTGTQKFLAIGGMIIDGLHEGDVLVVDELKSLHPLLTQALIKVFNNPKTNINNAQLIFASNDVSLLTKKLFRRDQILFSEKDEEGASAYYSLADIKDVSKEVSYEKYYLKGVFGSTPVINEYELDFNINQDDPI